MGPAIERLTQLWNGVTQDFLEGRHTNTRPPLDRWYRSYKRLDDVQLNAFCEPYLGDLTKSPKMVLLAYNPGEVMPSYQVRGAADGVYVKEMLTDYPSYSQWAASWPYLRDPWRTYIRDVLRRRVDHHLLRLRFMQRWFEDPSLTPNDRVDFEVYPWHSTVFNAKAFFPERDLIRDYVLEPVTELHPEWVFAFGRWWVDNLPNLGVEVEAVLGHGGSPYVGTAKERAKRTIMVGRLGNGVRVVAEGHSGGAGPPGGKELPYFRDAVRAACGADASQGDSLLQKGTIASRDDDERNR